jgi:DNA repair protein SbcD/Mre11
MRLLHVADVHLDAAYGGFGALAEERSEEVLNAFRRLPDAAAELRADAVLVAGDLFDGPHPRPGTLTAVRETFKRFVDLCIPVFLLPGNHDAISLKLNPYRELARAARVVVQNGEPPAGREWPTGDERGRALAEKHSVYLLTRPHLAEPVTVETESGLLHVYGAAYDAAECSDPTASFQRAPLAGVHVVLLHAYVHGAGRWVASRNALTLTQDDLDGLDVDYIALGDQHRPVLPDGFGGRPACYPGSFAATDLAETGARGFMVVDVEPGRPPRVEHHDAGVRPAEAVEIDVTSLPNDRAVVEAVAEAVSAEAIPVVRLGGEPAFPLDADVIQDDLIARFGHGAVSDDTRYYAAHRLNALARDDTVAGHVARLGRERISAAGDEAAREVAQRALRVVLRALEVDR